ncbi:NAD(P)-dependent oxidoreductase [Nodularia harveyana UHCC-0300]|uniref:NAD(P)-dependent oxidoreductase n=1 Tax=Nodularia harveyana UHCC-0300 TaxID=2974287 RepID=A0ABU5U920_9CYAN|nr:NAD(P)-dependent oxidoreductase [Nodularia harveyana]MEA5580025.1 NAD(P)-dependent oxidoreductase [Nodularia harveyana UHCC-0300]
MFKILSTAIIPKECLKSLPEEFSVDIFREKRPMDYAEILEKVSTKSYDAILCTYRDRIDGSLIKAAAGSRLNIIATMSTGTDHIDLSECQKHGIEVYNVPNITTNAVADYGVALLLLGVRRLDQSLQQEPDQEPWYYMWNLSGSSLSKMTIGIVGLGNIGTAIAQRLTGFGSKLIYYSRHRKQNIEQEYGIEFRPFGELLQESDAVIASCSLNAKTRNLFSLDTFTKMKSSSIFINIARGGICNQDDLYQALNSQEISMALLDVTNPEPLPPSHPLHQLENCLIFPHIATNVKNSRIDICNLALQKIYNNIRDFQLK